MKKRILLGVTLLTFVFAFSGILAQAATPDVDGVLWYRSVKEGASFSWTITDLDANGETTWDWDWANNVTLTEGEKITMEWSYDPDATHQPGLAGPLDYTNVTTTVGDYECNFTADETYFNFFVIPVYNNGTVGNVESALNALERFWFNSFSLPGSDLPVGQYTWNVAMDKTSTADVGADAKSGDIVMGYVTTHDFFDTLETEVFVFDIHYDAVSGFVQKLVYPSTMTGQILADDTEPMVLGLDSLVIEFDGGNGTWSGSAPGFDAPIVVTGLFAFAAIVVIRRRK